MNQEEHMKTLQISVVLCALILFAGAATAQQATPVTLTFNVPVHLTDLHTAVGYATVKCDVYDNDKIPVGQGLMRVSSVDGVINQTVSVVAEALPGKDITRGVQYTAKFTLAIQGAQDVTPSQSTSTPVEYRAKAGTPFTQLVGGEITW